MVTVIKPQQCF